MYFWYIVGRHETLSSRSCDIPEVFSQFQEFNKPELSKHRKHQHSNLIESELRGLSSELFTVLLHYFWKQSPGPCLIYMLNYLLKAWLIMLTIYLTMKAHHSSNVPS